MKTLAGCSVLVVSTIVGAVLFSGVRVVQYKVTGINSNMSPEMFLLIAPILALPIALVAGIAHAYFAARFKLRTAWQWIGAGLAYSSIFLAFVHPVLLVVPLITNPISVAWLRRRGFFERKHKGSEE